MVLFATVGELGGGALVAHVVSVALLHWVGQAAHAALNVVLLCCLVVTKAVAPAAPHKVCSVRAQGAASPAAQIQLGRWWLMVHQ